MQLINTATHMLVKMDSKEELTILAKAANKQIRDVFVPYPCKGKIRKLMVIINGHQFYCFPDNPEL